MSTDTAQAPAAGHAHGGDRPAHLAHHFEDEQQQFDAGKFGIWAFLLTEVLFFSGLFVTYAMLRGNYPAVFQYGSRYLDTFWGATNTIVLLVSSFTVAWGVRNAMLGQKRMLCVNLAITILCAGGFMGIKYEEYSHKIHEGLLWGGHERSIFKADPGKVLDEMKGGGHAAAAAGGQAAGEDGHGEAGTHAGGHAAPTSWAVPAGDNEVAVKDLDPYFRQKLGLFFAVYFCLTGLHGIHVLIGMVVLGWLLWRAMRGEFGPHYFNPIDFGALYWHLVDLIWIYLFPLLYLIS